MSMKRKKTRIIFLLFMLLVGILMIAGCMGEGRDPVLGTWEWSDNKGYVERYTFHENRSFQAEALGSTFSGTWEKISADHYRIMYVNSNDSGNAEQFTDVMLFDDETGRLFFPGHVKVS